MNFMKSTLSMLLLLAVTSINAQTVVRLATGTTLKTSGGVSINLKDVGIDNNGTITQAKGEGVFKFTGNKNVTIGGSSTATFDKLKIDKKNGAKVNLGNNLNIISSVAFSAGFLDLNTKNMTLNASASVSGESETARIVGPLGGEVIITRNMNKPNALNAGNLGAVITSASNLGLVTVRRGHKLQSGTGMQSSIARYYSIVPTSIQSSTIRLYYLDAELNSKPEGQLTIFRSADNGINWSNQSFNNRDAALNWVEKSGVTLFDRLTLSNAVAFAAKAAYHSQELAQQEKMVTNKFMVGPNPNNGNFWFIINGLEKETTVSLFTADGKPVKQFQVSSRQRQLVNGVPNGIYLLQASGFESFKVVVAESNAISLNE